MGQQVNVQRDLTFTGQANIDGNVKGNMSPERMTSVDWFDQRAIDLTNDYTSTLGGANDAVALTAGGENGAKLTTGTGDDEISYLAGGLIFDITQKPDIETRLEIENVSATIAFFGFSDAVTESTPDSTIDAESGSFTAKATDAVGFVIDADLESSSLYCASVNNGGAVQSVDTGLAYTDNQTKNLRVSLDESGNARFYVDGVQVGYIALAVADVPLCAIWNYGTRAAGGSTIMTARYLKKWQDVA